MRRYARAGLPLLAIAMLIMSCGQSAVTPEQVGGDKRVEPMPGGPFWGTLTQEHLESVWNTTMADTSFEQISGVVKFDEGGMVNGIGATYPNELRYRCYLTIPPNSVSGSGIPDEATFVIEIPRYETMIDRNFLGFDAFVRFVDGEGDTVDELNFYPFLTLTVCEFPRAEDPPVEGTEYFYRIFKGNGYYDVHDAQEVVRSPYTQQATYQISRLLVERSDKPDRSGTAVNETDPDDTD